MIGLACAGAPARRSRAKICAPGCPCRRASGWPAVRSDPARPGLAAVVQPTDSDFAPLSELTLAPGRGAVDDPAAWLREQLTLDLSPVDAALDELIHGADSPITGTPLAEQLQSWRGLLGSAADIAADRLRRSRASGRRHRGVGDGVRVGSGPAAPVHAVPAGRARRRPLCDQDPDDERAAAAPSGGDRQLVLVWRQASRAGDPRCHRLCRRLLPRSPRAKPEFAWDDPFLLRGAAHRGRAADPGHRPRVRAGAPDAAHPRGQSPRADRAQHLQRDGRARPARRDHRGLRLRRRQPDQLRPGRARARARRFRLPLDVQRAVVPGHGADLRVRLRGAAPGVPAASRHRRDRRLLRPDRAGPRLRSRAR